MLSTTQAGGGAGSRGGSRSGWVGERAGRGGAIVLGGGVFVFEKGGFG